MKKHILLDFDNTAGLEKRPMDDALALLYLLGRPEEAEIRGITCTHGNASVGEVLGATTRLLRDIRREDIPLLAGSEPNQSPISPAAHFIVEQADRHPGELSLLGLGALTNLYGAYLLDQKIFEKLREIVLMGGYTGPVIYHGHSLDELNFSSDPLAAACVLRQGRHLSILTGNNTLLPSRLPQEEFLQELSRGGAGAHYIIQTCGIRFSDQEERFGNAVSYCWDAVAAVYLLHPELYTDSPACCCPSPHTMKAGWLAPAPEPVDCGVTLNLPVVRDAASYRREMYGGWMGFSLEAAP